VSPVKDRTDRRNDRANERENYIENMYTVDEQELNEGDHNKGIIV